MTKEPNFLLSPTLCYLYVFSNNLSRLLPIFTVLQRGDERRINRRASSLPKKYSPSGQREEDSIYEKIRAIACPDFRFFSFSSAYLYAKIVVKKE